MQPEPGPDVWLRRARRGAALVAAIALLTVAVTGTLLTWRYYPDGGPAIEMPPSARWSRRLVRWHEGAMVTAVPALAVWCGLTIVDRTTRPRRTAVVVTGMSLALIALTAQAWHQVQWDQLGLLAVTTGDDLSGLWYAAFSDEVRFAIVDGIGEVPPAELQQWVVVHLLAPVLALAVLALGWRASEPPRGPRRSIVAPPHPARLEEPSPPGAPNPPAIP